MSVRDLFEKVSKLPPSEGATPLVPPAELVALVIRMGRGLRSWKQTTLAEFAGVSLSTVERAERGETVSPDNLDRIAEALGYGSGYFTAPRVPISREEATAQLSDTYGYMESVKVGPLRKQSQVRAAGNCHAYLPHCPDLPEEFRADVENLVEWFDLASFLLSEKIDGGQGKEAQRRKLYGDILRSSRDLEKRGLNVLLGVMPAPQPGIPDWKVAVLSISLKSKDPGASKREFIFVDRRLVVIRQDESQI